MKTTKIAGSITVCNERKADIMDEMKSKCVKGALLYTSWGYEQTNIDFFQIVERVSDSFVLIQEIAGKWENEGWSRDKGMPDAGNFTGKPMRKKIQSYGIKIDECRTAYFCQEGKAYHSTSYA